MSPVPDHLSFVVVGHVDHGKSTLIGRLLHDTHSLAEGVLERVAAACAAEGMPFEHAFLLDALLEEQAQNITLDTTRVPFRTARRHFTIIDAPGHRELLQHMITGAASADAAVLVVDASEGVREQTRRHAYLLSLLGLKQIVVVVNKMDLVAYAEAGFTRIQSELTEFLGRLGVAPAHFIPVSAKHGEGLLRASAHTPWHRGPALLEALEQFRATPPAARAPLRLVVQDIYRFDPRRLVAGWVETGTVNAGDPLVFHPGGKAGRVRAIATWPGGAVPGPVSAGSPVAITLEDEIVIERGQIGAPPDAPPVVAREFTARLFWLHSSPLRVGEVLPLRLGTQQVDARLVAVARVVDTLTLLPAGEPTNEIKHHEAAEVVLRVRRPLACEMAGTMPALGRFVLMRDRRIAGGGVIDAAVSEPDVSGDNFPVSTAARANLLGHRGAIIWLTGLSASGKSTLATGLEQRLFAAGLLPVTLDGDVLRAGLCRGLGFSETDRHENIRRAAEAALLLAEAGCIVITALISPFRADRQLAAERCQLRGVPFAEVFVNAPLAECERRDPKKLYARARAGQITHFTGLTSPYEAPVTPTLELRTDQESVGQSLEKLVALALRLARP